MEETSKYRSEWEKSRGWIERFTSDFLELNNLVNNTPIHHTSKAPRVGSITLSAAVRQIPRQSAKQLPTMSVEVNGSTRTIPAILCDFVLRRIIFSQDTFGMSNLSRIQLGAETAFTNGFQFVQAALSNDPFANGVKMQLIHHSDFAIRQGVSDYSDSDFFSVRTRKTKEELKDLLKAAKENPETTWDVSALEELVDRGPQNEANYERWTPDIMNGGGKLADNTYDIITRYGTGPYHDIVVFSPGLEKPLRKTKSKSKFGYPRLQALVIDPNPLTPFGVSRVRLASAPANYGNLYLQSTAKMQLTNANPPTFQKGEFVGEVSLRGGAHNKALDPNADLKLMELSNSTLNQFQQVLQYTDNQILNVMGVTAGGTGIGNTNSQYSKTAAGVRMEQGIADLSSMQVTHILEGFLRQYALTALDLYISEQMGEGDLIIDDKAKDDINQLEEAKFVPTPMQPVYIPAVGDDNRLSINWEELYESIHTWTVNIDMSMGKNDLDEKKRADLQDTAVMLGQTADPNNPSDQIQKQQIIGELLETVAPDTAALANQQAQSIQQQSAQVGDVPQ